MGSAERLKYQLLLEKRFERFKHVYCTAVVQKDRASRNQHVYIFRGLDRSGITRTRDPRSVEKAKEGIFEALSEDRDALHPTASQNLKTFAGISSYAMEVDHGRLAEYRDDLKPQTGSPRSVDVVGDG